MTKPLSIWGEKPLKNALEQLVRPLLSERDKLLVTLQTEWRLIVGEDLAAVSHPKSLTYHKQERVLTLAVRHGMQTLITYELPEILQKIGQFIGEGRISSIKIARLSTARK